MNNLQSKRTQAGLSQSQLAKLVGMSVRTLQHYECGYRDINKASAQTVLSIADALKCDPADILNKGE